MTFDNRVAVVTGAAGRIGRALAEELGKEGVKLALADIRIDALQEFVSSLTANGICARAYQIDITDSEDVTEKTKNILADFGKVDILVNNAGKWPSAKFVDMEEKFWSDVIDLNLNSVFRMTKALLPGMIAQQYGRVINLGSIAGEVGLPSLSAYSVSKAAVIMLTKTLAMEVAKTGVTVNCVSPGMILDAKVPNTGTWLGRSGTGDEVARVIAFLAADESSYITGVDYTVDGGRILGPHYSCN